MDTNCKYKIIFKDGSGEMEISSPSSEFKLEDTEELPDEELIVSVLGKKYHKPEQYSEDEQKLFASYHHLFKLDSKPANHLQALADLNDDKLLQNIPGELSRLADRVKEKLQEIPE